MYESKNDLLSKKFYKRKAKEVAKKKKGEKIFLNDLILGQYINACKLRFSRFF
jgi:hypothetical protein